MSGGGRSCRRCTTRRRRARATGLLRWAARRAGYGTPDGKTTNNALSVIANRLVHDDRVLEAIAEYSRRVVRGAITPEAVFAVKQAIRDPRHKDHIRAAAMVLDRTDPLQTTHTVRVEDVRPPSIEVTERVLQRIEELARRAGLLPQAGAKLIDGTCDEIGEAQS